MGKKKKVCSKPHRNEIIPADDTDADADADTDADTDADADADTDDRRSEFGCHSGDPSLVSCRLVRLLSKYLCTLSIGPFYFLPVDSDSDPGTRFLSFFYSV